MTLSNAILNYPWDGVPLVAVDPNSTGDIYMVKREIQPNGSVKEIILSTETAEEVYSLDNNVGDSEPNNTWNLKCHTTSLEKSQKPNNRTLKKLMGMENWDWKPLRSLVIGNNF